MIADSIHFLPKGMSYACASIIEGGLGSLPSKKLHGGACACMSTANHTQGERQHLQIVLAGGNDATDRAKVLCGKADAAATGRQRGLAA